METGMVQRQRKVDACAMVWALVLGFGTGNVKDSQMEQLRARGQVGQLPNDLSREKLNPSEQIVPTPSGSEA